MEDFIKDILDQIHRYNKELKKQPLSEKDLKEITDGYHDFLLAERELKIILEKIKLDKLENFELVNQNFMQLHLLIDRVRYYFEDLHEKIKIIFKNLPDVY